MIRDSTTHRLIDSTAFDKGAEPSAPLDTATPSPIAGLSRFAVEQPCLGCDAASDSTLGAALDVEHSLRVARL